MMNLQFKIVDYAPDLSLGVTIAVYEIGGVEV